MNKNLAMQILRPAEISLLSVIMIIGVIALSVELIEYEEIAKVIVIPSLVLLIGVSGYAMVKALRIRQSLI